tara:strand:+ start:2172 stop:4967 length:2796 start_codon:yes stop_codon:yes gene_type:complete
MMNRSVMQRQMFAKGGAAFPDLSGDGAVTQKDILMGRGVPMQDGGMAMMPPPPGAAPMGPPPMPPGAAMAPPGAADQGPFDPAVLEGLLVDSAQSMEAMDAAAEEGDYATVINSIRGDELPLEARYEELAGVVGPEDSQQTPESVLTLLQPVMQMAAVDQGIGGLAQDQMTTPVEGPMAEGIMSTVNMEGAPPGPEQMAMAAPGGAAPVNFRQGGAVQYFNPENKNRVVQPDPLGGRLGEIYSDKQALYQSIISPEDQQTALDEQKRMTKAQMLFDIAQGALAFATPGETAMSPAERLAQVAQPVLGNIGARAGELQKFKQGQEQEQRALNLQALGSAEGTLTAELAAKAAAEEQDDQQSFLSIEARKDRAHDLLKITKTADINNTAREDTQEHAKEMQNLLNDNRIAMIGLQGDDGRESILLQSRLQTQRDSLLQAYERADKTLAFERQLKIIGVNKINDIEKMDYGADQNKELTRLRAALDMEAQLATQAHQAAQNVLNREADKNTQLNDQTFRKEMAEELRKFTKDEAAIDRAIAATQRSIDNAFATSADERAEQVLTIQQAAQVLDQSYKMGNLALEQEAAKIAKLGSASDSAAITYISNDDRLNAYANNQLAPQEKTIFEQTVINYINPDNSKVWDGTKYVFGKPMELAPKIRASIESGNPEFFAQISRPGGGVQAGGNVTETGGNNETVTVYDSPEFNQALFTPEKGVNLDSPEWDRVPTNIINEGVKYERATGIGEIFTRVGNYFTENMREALGFRPMDEYGREIVQADRDINILRETVLQEMNNWTDGRVLKTTQDALRRTMQDLKPGIFSSDEKARETLESTMEAMAKAFSDYAAVDPYYNPSSEGDFTSAQVTKARKRATEIRGLIAEVRALDKAYTIYFDSITPGGVGNQRTGASEKNLEAGTRSIINQMLEANRLKNEG